MVCFRRFGVLSLIFVALLFLPGAFALTITDTVFFSSVSNFTIHVDSVDLSNVTITNTTITFFNVTSEGTNFTNVNDTFDARADFIGLAVGLTIRNVNTSVDVFTSAISNQDHNATFSPGQVLRLLTLEEINAIVSSFITGLSIFATFLVIIVLALIGKTIFDLFRRREVDLLSVVKAAAILVAVAVVVLLGIAFANVINQFL